MSNNLQVPLQELSLQKISQTFAIDWYAKQFEISLKNIHNIQQTILSETHSQINQCRTNLKLHLQLQQLLNRFTIFYSLMILIVVGVIIVYQSEDFDESQKNQFILIILSIGIPLDIILLIFSMKKLNDHYDMIQKGISQLNESSSYKYKFIKLVPWKSYINYRRIEIFQKKD